MGATYPELEWAMDFEDDDREENALSTRQREVLARYRALHTLNRHKMEPVPVCRIPPELRASLR